MLVDSNYFTFGSKNDIVVHELLKYGHNDFIWRVKFRLKILRAGGPFVKTHMFIDTN